MKRIAWLLSVVIAGGLGAASARAVPEAASPYHNLGVFARALAHVELSWVETPDQDALIYGAIRGMIHSLDPHSAFMDPEEYRVLTSDTAGQFGGVGVEIEARDGWLTVLSAFEDGPARGVGGEVEGVGGVEVVLDADEPEGVVDVALAGGAEGAVGAVLGAVSASIVARGALRRGATPGGTAFLIGSLGIVVAMLALIPLAGFVLAVLVPAVAARRARQEPARHAGLRSLAK